LVGGPFSVSTAARGDAVLMFDLRGAVREAIWDAIASMVTVGLLITVLVVSVLPLARIRRARSAFGLSSTLRRCAGRVPDVAHMCRCVAFRPSSRPIRCERVDLDVCGS
jgi:hypothetical protein